ncbi:hypothetical protein CHS0354_008819 [Potamilus streckersoni]|uniref:CAP-Gly domain-containing protein n=1 Tax=Potamilus streckersoni TaxID=2493646 RepID=A0AAE0SNY5_9BIVA|nr:hypothetical protein CHS0354_008819 [Potamilus streckersoni]
MDSTGSEHSPPLSENAGSSSWNNWENEISSISGLNLDGNSELSNLVEDKEIAARAVAFVVNSTRKGIVPLCADVANLFRVKRSLEKRVNKLKQENEALRSRHASNSTSPTPQSLSSYTDKTPLQDQDHYRPCSQCSQCSSSLSYSPKVNNFRLSSLQYSPASSRESHKQSSPHSTGSSFRSQNGYSAVLPTENNHLDDTIEIISEINNFNKEFESSLHTTKEFHKKNSPKSDFETHENENEIVTEVEIHHPKVSCEKAVELQPFDKANSRVKRQKGKNLSKFAGHGKGMQTYNDAISSRYENFIKNTVMESSHKTFMQIQSEFHLIADSCRNSRGDQRKVPMRRKNSLPEIVSEPNESAQKVCMKISKEVQCCLFPHTDRTLEEQFIKTVRLNSKLAEDLGSARKEIEMLKGRLKELEMNHLARDSTEDQVLYENECGDQNDDEAVFYTNKPQQYKNNYNGYSKNSSPKRSSNSTVYLPSPLPHCKCTGCQEMLGSEDDLSHYSDNLLDEPHRYVVNGKLQVHLDDHVEIKGERTGIIRYIGHIDHIGKTNSVFVGLELDSPVGRHDGYFNGKRYFYCQKDHGIFVPLQDVICKVSKK